jgi:prepilin peptidase CpaA
METAVIGGAVLAYLWAMTSDLLYRRISNRLCLILLVLGLLLWPLGLVSAHGMALRLGMGLAIFAVGVVLHALRLFGGGDIKLMAASMPILGASALPFLVHTALYGGLLALFVLAAMRLRQRGSTAWLVARLSDGGVPYGLAIGIAGMQALFSL